MGFLFASYQSPLPTQHQSRQIEAAAQDREGDSPLSVDGAEDSKNRKRQEGASEFWAAKLTDWLLAGFTALLVLFTYRLWRSTEKLWESTTATVNLAREEFVATHRPKIRIHTVEVTRRLKDGDDTNLIGASILGFNVGESSAKNLEVRGQIFMGPRFALDVQRPIVKTFEEVLSGQKFHAEVTSDCPVVHAAAGLRTGIHCYCLGWIAYWDGNGHRRETGFCLRAQFSTENGDRWVSAEEPEHEYEY
jgi:hypothetical protein